MTYNVGQPTPPWNRREREVTPRKLNNSPLFFQICFSVPSFLFSHREGGREMVGEHAGGCRLHRSDHQLYSPTV
jgi:hypothetical protein